MTNQHQPAQKERRWTAPYTLAMGALLLLVTGCATVDQRAGFSEVSTAVEGRSGKRIVWNLGTELDAQAARDVHVLLLGSLSADAVVQVALLNNRELQAFYAELGVAQADLVQGWLHSEPWSRTPSLDQVLQGP